MSLLRKSKRLEIREGARHGPAPSCFFSWLGAVLQSRVLRFAVSKGTTVSHNIENPEDLLLALYFRRSKLSCLVQALTKP